MKEKLSIHTINDIYFFFSLTDNFGMKRSVVVALSLAMENTQVKKKEYM